MSRRIQSRHRGFRSGPAIDPERRNAILLLGGIGVVLALALGLIAYGYYTDRIAPAGEAVLRVGDHEFDYAYVERRAKAAIEQGTFDTKDAGNSLSDLLSTIQREELTRIVAREQGVTASRDEVDAKVRSELGLNEDLSREETADVLRGELHRAGISLDEYLDQVRVKVLTDKLQAGFVQAVPPEGEQVDLRLIRAGSQANALAAKQKLDDGADFAAVAAENSQDKSVQGGEYGWTARGVLDPQVEDVAFNLIGRSDVIETDTDFYIIEVLDKQVRPIDDAAKDEIGEASLNRLLTAADKQHPTQTLFNQEQLVRLSRALGLSNG